MYSSATQTATTQHSTAQHSTAQHSTAQHSTAQHSTAQHSTYIPGLTQRSPGFCTAITIMPGSGGEIVGEIVAGRSASSLDMSLSTVCVSSFALSDGWDPRPGRIPTAACGLTHDLQNRSECWSASGRSTHREDLPVVWIPE